MPTLERLLRSAAIHRAIAHGTDIGLQAITGYVLVVLAARSADLATFGEFAFALAVAGGLQQIAVYGTQTQIYGRAAARPAAANRLMWSAVLLSVGIGSSLYAVTAGILAVTSDPGVLFFFLIAGIRIISGFTLVVTADGQGRQAIASYVPLRLLTLTISLLLAITAFLTHVGIWSFAVLWGIEPLLYGLILIVQRRRDPRRKWPRRPRLSKLTVAATPIALQQVLVVFYARFDQIYVMIRFDSKVSGLYAAAARLAEAVTMLALILILAVGPAIIREVQSTGRLGPRSLLVLSTAAVASVGLSLLAYIWGGALLSVTFGPEYAGVSPVLSAYLLATCFVGYGALASRAIAARGKNLVNLVSGLVGAVLCLVLTIVLTEVMGLVGAALATTLTYFAACAVLWYFWLSPRRAPS